MLSDRRSPIPLLFLAPEADIVTSTSTSSIPHYLKLWDELFLIDIVFAFLQESLLFLDGIPVLDFVIKSSPE